MCAARTRTHGRRGEKWESAPPLGSSDARKAATKRKNLATDTPHMWLWPPATKKDRLCWRTLKFRGYLPRHTKSTVFLPPSATVIKGPPIIHSLPILILLLERRPVPHLASFARLRARAAAAEPPPPSSAPEPTDERTAGLRARAAVAKPLPPGSAPEPLPPGLRRPAPRHAATGCGHHHRRIVRALGAGVTWPGAGAAATPAAPLPRRLSRAAPRSRLCRLASHLSHAAAPLPRLRRDSHRPPTRATASLVSALLPAGAGVAARSMVGRVWTPWRALRRW